MKNTTIKKAALYDPYLDVMGGGERYMLSILRVLQEHDYEITIYWNNDISKQLFSQLNIPLQNVYYKKIPSNKSFLSKAKEKSQYDIYLYVTDGSYQYSLARKNIVYCMVPDKNLYNFNLINKLKTFNTTFITHSKYVNNLLMNWGIKNDIIYPYIEDSFFQENSGKKDKTILMVGRFFTHLHAKRQDVGITWFKELKEKYPAFADYKLILTGMVKPEDEAYIQSLRQLVGDDVFIEFKPNISFTQLLDLYRSSKFYWHFAGYGVDEKLHPENVEHLGITPLEAMASGCITCAYAAGGPKEIISNNDTGILFTTQDELYEQMNDLVALQPKVDNMIQNARNYVQNTFSYNAFQKRVVAILKP